jgi:hypothetical protein
MDRTIESFFPLSLGIVLLLILAGALFAAPIRIAVLLTGILFFGSGLVFARVQALSARAAGIALVAPFLVTSVFLMVAFGARFILFPLLASGGVAAGMAARRRSQGWPGVVMPALVWTGCVVCVAWYLVPQVFDRPILN